MSDPSVRYVRRLIAEEENKGGMRVGMPQITIDTANAERVCRLADRLARIEAACLLRSEIDAPEWATHWEKVPNAGCFFTDAPHGADGHWIRAKDYRPDTDAPVTLPIIDA